MEREQINFYLQQVPLENLAVLCQEIKKEASVMQVQKPTSQTLLLPVRDPINGGKFISGEVLVTSAVIQVNGVNGWAMVMDDNSQQASIIATIDGAYAAGVLQSGIEELIRLGEKITAVKKAETNTRVNGTRVAFDLL